jgi:hypothetical protein
MRVLIDQSFFALPPARSLVFLEIFALARDGRHHILTRPSYGPTRNEPLGVWLAEQSSAVGVEIRRILERSLIAAPSLPKGASTIAITTETCSDWKKGRLVLEDAVRLLRMPLGILLENRRNDFRFLLMLAPPAQRRDLQSAMDAGWLEILQGGGLPEIEAMLDELDMDCTSDIVRLLRLWVMFDKDSHPDDRCRPSEKSENVKRICDAFAEACPWPLNYCRLGRRAIENYLPAQLLRRWQSFDFPDRQIRRREQEQRRRRIDALCRLKDMNPAAYWQFNMKNGLKGDLAEKALKQIKEQGQPVRDEDLDPLFRRLGDGLRDGLAEGFGRSVSALFAIDDPSCESWFQTEYDRGPPDQSSREDILSSLFARL